jgi:methylmalonyl-CoA mutase cobalamin-binding domain/chain
MVVATARDEDVDAIGLSMLSGAHMTLVPRVIAGLRAEGLDIPLVVGGIIPTADATELRKAGVAEVLTPGASTDDIVEVVTRVIQTSQAQPSGSGG